MLNWKKFIIALCTGALLVTSSAGIIAANFTKQDASWLRKYLSFDDDDEYEEEDSKSMVKYLDKKNESLLKVESNKKKALEIMNKIQENLDRAKRELKEENWNDAGSWAVIGMIWAQALDNRLAVEQNSNYYDEVKKTK